MEQWNWLTFEFMSANLSRIFILIVVNGLGPNRGEHINRNHIVWTLLKKLYASIFEKSQEEHNKLYYQFVFWNKFHRLQSLSSQNLMKMHDTSKVLWFDLKTQINFAYMWFFGAKNPFSLINVH